MCEAQVQYRPLFVDESVRPGGRYFYRVVARNASGSSEPSNVVGPVQATHRTLVDELWNDSRIFLKEGKLAFAQNEARKFKEDCHRLAGGAKSSVVYYVPGGIHAARAFLFTQSDQPAIRMLFSKDGKTFEPVEATTRGITTHGEDAYGFWKARVCSVPVRAYSSTEKITPDGVTTNHDYVKIEFLTDAQLSRVEIDYGRVD
jgi:hypothetical protein